ncbi:MAG: uncharacterized protein A8A55_1141 [Amphiamblys sp. WSBS2006]|nr:MAG: uncharacterized protein A8A55_1141 [Amphiamblys sp. WSBS2006]
MSEDKRYLKYKAAMETLANDFETVREWADFNSFLLRLSRTLRKYEYTSIPATNKICKRLSQCLQTGIPSGIHKKTLELFAQMFHKIDRKNFAENIAVYTLPLFSFFPYGSGPARRQMLQMFGDFFVGDRQILADTLQNLLFAMLSNLENEDEGFAKQVAGNCERMRETLGEASFYTALWTCLLDTKKERRSACKLILELCRPRDGTESFEGVNRKTIVAAAVLNLADKNPLVVRDTLDIFIRHFPVDGSFFSPEDKLGIVYAALGAFHHRDVSISRRIADWLTKKETQTEEAVVLISAAVKKCSLGIDKHLFRSLLHLLDTPSIGHAVCENIFAFLLTRAWEVERAAGKEAMRTVNYFFNALGGEIIYAKILQLAEEGAGDVLLFAIPRLKIWAGECWMAENELLLLAAAENTRSLLAAGSSMEAVEKHIDVALAAIENRQALKESSLPQENSQAHASLQKKLGTAPDASLSAAVSLLREQTSVLFLGGLGAVIKSFRHSQPLTELQRNAPRLAEKVERGIFKNRMPQDQALWETLCMKLALQERGDASDVLLSLFLVFLPHAQTVPHRTALVERLLNSLWNGPISTHTALFSLHRISPLDDTLLSMLSAKKKEKKRNMFRAFSLLWQQAPPLPLFSLVYPLALFVEGLADTDLEVAAHCTDSLLLRQEKHFLFYDAILFFLHTPHEHFELKETDLGNGAAQDKKGIGLVFLECFDDEFVPSARYGFSLLHSLLTAAQTTPLQAPLKDSLARTMAGSSTGRTYGDAFFSIATKYFFAPQTRRETPEVSKVVSLFLETDAVHAVGPELLSHFASLLCSSLLLFPCERTADCLTLQKVLGTKEELVEQHLSKIRLACLGDTDLTHWTRPFSLLLGVRNSDYAKKAVLVLGELVQVAVKHQQNSHTVRFLLDTIETQKKRRDLLGALSSDCLEKEIVFAVCFLLKALWLERAEEFHATVSLLHRVALPALFMALLELERQAAPPALLRSIHPTDGLSSFLAKRIENAVSKKESTETETALFILLLDRMQGEDVLLCEASCQLLLTKTHEVCYEKILLAAELCRKHSAAIPALEKAMGRILESISTKNTKTRYKETAPDRFARMLSLVGVSCEEHTAQSPLTREIFFFGKFVLPFVALLPLQEQRAVILQNTLVNTVVPALKSKTSEKALWYETFLKIVPGTPKSWKKELWDLFLYDPAFFQPSRECLEKQKALLGLIPPYEKLAELFEKPQTTALFTESERMKIARLRRVSFLVFAAPKNTFGAFFPNLQVQISEILKTPPSSLHAEIYLLLRVMFLRFPGIDMKKLEPVLVGALFELFQGDKTTQRTLQPLLAASKLLYDFLALPRPVNELYRWSFAGSREGNSVFARIIAEIEQQNTQLDDTFDPEEFLARKEIAEMAELYPFLCHTSKLVSDPVLNRNKNNLEKTKQSISAVFINTQ